MSGQRGFTLIELVVVIVVISAGLLGMTGLFSTAVRALSTNQDMLTVGQFAQSCAEEVLAFHHRTNLATAATVPTLCTSTQTGYARTLSVSTPYLNQAAKPWCPSNVTCRDVSITVTSSLNPGIRSQVDLMLAAY